MPSADSPPQSNLLSDAMLLAGTGGLLDAVVYLNHGHVFANAMTGNVVLLGIAFVGRDWREITPHTVPIAAFIAGVATSKHIRSRLAERALLLGLSFELLTLLAMSWLPPGFPEMAFTGIIAYVAAFQVASFRRVHQFSFNSTFLTGNLRDVVEGLYDASSQPRISEAGVKGQAQAHDLGLICLCFLAGAVIGAWAAPRFGNRSFLLAEPLLLLVAFHAVRHRS